MQVVQHPANLAVDRVDLGLEVGLVLEHVELKHNN